MAHSLITTILSQANNPNTKIEDIPNLIEQLKSDSRSRSPLKLFELVGGLGSDEYNNIQSCLTISKTDKEQITAINDEKMMQFGINFLQQADKKPAYRAGICFALVAVYGSEYPRKLAAYQQLAALFKAKGYLENDDMLCRVNEFLTPLSLTGDYYPTRKIIWSWEIKGKKDILSFETQRQNSVLVGIPTFSIANSLRLLGLTAAADDLDKTKITTAVRTCREKLKDIAGLTAQEKLSSTLMKNFTSAEQTLLEYLHFAEFNYKEHFKTLDNLLSVVAKADISQPIPFNDTNKCFSDLDKEVKTIIQTASAKESPYITKNKIEDRLGKMLETSPTEYTAQRRLQDTAKAYWDTIRNKVNNLLLNTFRLMNDKATSTTMDSFRNMCIQLENALEVLSGIKGSALEESSLLFMAAIDVDDTISSVRNIINALKQKIEEYDESIKERVGLVVERAKAAAKETTSNLEAVDINRAILVRVTMIRQINEGLVWLINLDKKSQECADNAFKKYVVSQPTPDEIVDGVTKALSTLSKPFIDAVLSKYLGRNKYNPQRELKVTLKNFFLASKNEDIKQTACTLIGDLKTHMADMGEQFPEYDDIKGKISVATTIPATVYMTFDLAKQYLEENRDKLDKSTKLAVIKLNSDLQEMITSLLNRYEVAFHHLNQIMQVKSSLDFSWQTLMTEFVQKQQELEKDITTLSTKVPPDLNGALYIEPQIRKLIKKEKECSVNYQQKTNEMKECIGKNGLDALKYLLLKKLIRQEKKLYQAQGIHHQARTESLDRLSTAMERIDGVSLNNRMESLAEAVQHERTETRASQKTISFLGNYRSTRLEAVYTKIIDASEHLIKLKPTESWTDVSLSLDTLKYMMLKAQVQQEITLYATQGIHHQDRQDSLARLQQKIDSLDKNKDNMINRFTTLFTTIQEEEKTTSNSQLKVGFFGNWRPCRLQTVYAKILTSPQL